MISNSPDGGKAAKYELVSQQSPQQPVGLGNSPAAGKAVKNELASQQVSPQQPVGLGFSGGGDGCEV